MKYATKIEWVKEGCKFLVGKRWLWASEVEMSKHGTWATVDNGGDDLVVKLSEHE